MKRVMIVGGPGSGKSTLAIMLGAKTGLPVHHMDKIHYRPGWVERTRAEKDKLSREVHATDRWIFEGGHSSTYADRVARADTFIWLDVPVGRRMFRVLKRSLQYRGQTRPDLQDGCPEQFNRQTL
ncbi:MAG: DNA topology modulation protein FlaR, partial [Roseibium sp.]